MVVLAILAVAIATFRVVVGLRYYERVAEDLASLGDVRPSLRAALVLLADALLLAASAMWLLGIPAR
jgi:hypothetical protein